MLVRGFQVIVVGERINGQFPQVAKAIDSKDTKYIQDLAGAQVTAGAHILDINTGPGREDSAGAMAWLVKTVQDSFDVRLSLDSPSLKVQQAGLTVCRHTPMINSTTAEQKRIEKFLPLAKEHNAEIVCLTINEKGIPNSVDGRSEIAMTLLANAFDAGLSPEQIYLDPVVLPVTAAQDQCHILCEALTAFRTLNTPSPKTIVGLSNVSSGAEERSLLNRTYLAMLLGRGLDAAIVDPNDEELMKVVKAAEVLLNQKLYAHSFLRV
jgi:5-methyltetrahydrofolate corrinoid/iron sulfur protein methyltransferase